MNISLRYSGWQANNFLKALIFIDLSFAFLYGVLHILVSDWPLGGLHILFDLDAETSLPTWFSTMQLFLAGTLLFAVGNMQEKESRLPSFFFYSLSLIFVFLSADEGAVIHEKISAVARKLDLNWMLINGTNGAWFMIYGFAAAIVFWFLFPYLRIAWKYQRRASKLTILGGFIFLTGAVFFELISYYFLRDGSNQIFYKLEVMFEEFLEMSGISIFIRALLSIKQTESFDESHYSSELQNRSA